MEIYIVSEKFVKPSSPTPSHLTSLKLSFIDHLVPSSAVPLIFYFSASDENADENVKRSERLEKSLSETLTLFYPFAGRYFKDDLLVRCNDEGVRYLEAKVNGRLDEIIEGRGDLEQLDCLVPTFEATDSYSKPPLLIIQVNNFECGGFAIVLLVSHKLFDAVTASTFVNSWATASRLGASQVNPPSFNLGVTIPARPDMGVEGPRLIQESIKFVTRRFVFDKNAISALKLKAAAPTENNSDVRRLPTRVEIVSATIWRALINTARARHGRLRPSLLVHSLNLRGKTSPPMPENTCGNFYVVAPARFTPGEGNMELHHLVALIGDAIRENIKSYANIAVDSDEFFWKVFNSFKEANEEQNKQEEIDVRWFTSRCRTSLYAVDFGWGKPCWVTGTGSRPEMVSLDDTKCGEGVEAWVTLNEQDMLQFQQEQDIVRFTSQLKH